MEDESKVSTKLCVKCFKKTIEFYEFKAQALKSEAALKSIDVNSLSLEIKDPKDGDGDEVPKDKIKTEIELVDIEDVIDNGFESDARYDEVEVEIKDELKTGDRSEDELLSVIKQIKYEFIEEKENGMYYP